MKPIFTALALVPLAAPSVTSMQVRSRAFGADEAVPAAHLCTPGALPPPLAWSGAPEGTRSFVVVIDDPAPGRSFVHWVVYNLPPTVNEVDGALPPAATSGLNSTGRPGYAPPCPTAGMHFFRFKVFALDTVLPTFAVPSDDRITTAMHGHILGAGQMFGSWIR